VTYDEEAALLGKSKREEPALTFGMIWIIESDRQRITEDGGPPSNVTLWSRRFEMAFFGSHANFICLFYAGRLFRTSNDRVERQAG
jgi:hypothetical protein